jgi:hypothetical protein
MIQRCKVEAFAGEARPIEAALCNGCRSGMTCAVVTVLPSVEAPSDVTVIYQ